MKRPFDRGMLGTRGPGNYGPGSQGKWSTDRLRVECIAFKNTEVPVKRNNVAIIVVVFWGDIE